MWYWRILSTAASFSGPFKLRRNCCLLLIDKARAKDKTYVWLSVRWKTKTKMRNLFIRSPWLHLSLSFFAFFFPKKNHGRLKPSEKTGAGTGNLKKSSSEESTLHARWDGVFSSLNPLVLARCCLLPRCTGAVRASYPITFGARFVYRRWILRARAGRW